MAKTRVKVESLLLVCLMLGLLVGQSTANKLNKVCYRICFLICLIGTDTGIEGCWDLCKKLCVRPSLNSSSQSPASFGDVVPITDSQYFCTLGCASLLCTTLSSKENSDEEKIGACVDSCSRTCTKNNNAPSEKD